MGGPHSLGTSSNNRSMSNGADWHKRTGSGGAAALDLVLLERHVREGELGFVGGARGPWLGQRRCSGALGTGGQTHAHTHIHAYTHTYTHTHTHAHTCIHTYVHTHKGFRVTVGLGAGYA